MKSWRLTRNINQKLAAKTRVMRAAAEAPKLAMALDSDSVDSTT